MQSEQTAGAQLNSQSHVHSQQAATGDSMQSEQTAGSSSMPDGMVQHESTHHESVLAAEDPSGCSMMLVEAAALAASSPGAIVRVPTSTMLSQADQIALRYQNQVSSPTAFPNLQCSCTCFSLCMPLVRGARPIPCWSCTASDAALLLLGNGMVLVFGYLLMAWGQPDISVTTAT